MHLLVCTTLFLSTRINDPVEGDLPRPLVPTMAMPTDLVVYLVVGTLLDPVHSMCMGDVDFAATPQERLELCAYDGRGSVGEFCGTFRLYRHKWCR